MVGNYVTYQIKAGGSAHCRCFAPNSPYENLEHILATCSAYSDIRNRMIEEYMILCSLAKTNVFWQETISDKNTFWQFILDPASFNLTQRMYLSDPILGALYESSRD